MAVEVSGLTGGISGLQRFVTEHKGAISYDLQTRLGKSLWDVGRTLGWSDFRDFVENLPPNGYESALFRSTHPRSWWVTPEMKQFASIQYVLELANWQRGGGNKGDKPKPPKFPEDRPVDVKSREELAERRKANREHLRRRRAQRRR